MINVEGETEFLGYAEVESTASVRGLFVDGEARDVITAGESAVVILDRTPFYGESGGQVGDTGYISTDSARLEVRDTTKAQGHHLHHVVVIEGALNKGDHVRAVIDASLRTRIKANHSATHLMHEALRQVLGEHVQQKGSLVDADKLRFDFSHTEAMTADELAQVAGNRK